MAQYPGATVTRLLRQPVSGDTHLDVTWDEERIAKQLAELGSVDVLVCAHGADVSSPPLRQAPYQERLRALWEVDVAGTIKLVRQTIPHLALPGMIVLMGSDEVDEGRPGETAELYAAAKGAVTSYARSLAATLGSRARVHVVAVGWVLTRWGLSLSPDRRAEVVRKSRTGHWQSPAQVAAVIERLVQDVGTADRSNLIVPID